MLRNSQIESLGLGLTLWYDISDGKGQVGCGVMDWIQLAQDRDRGRALVNGVMKIRVA